MTSFNNSNFRVRFKNDLHTCMRCWGRFSVLTRSFTSSIVDVSYYEVNVMEEDLITGKDLEQIPLKVDALGNQGHLQVGI